MSLSLRSLSDHDILFRTRALTVQERELTLLVLVHLNEIERRRLHLKLGYASMFDYCTSSLAYSASAAMRRIRTARCMARFPEVYGLLESNEVNLSTISQVSRILTKQNRTDILRRIRRRSQREVEAIVAEYEPRAALPRERVRTVVMRVPVAVTPSAGQDAKVEPDRASVPLAMDAYKKSEKSLSRANDLETGHNRNGCERAGPSGADPEKHNRNGCAPDSPADRPATGTAKLERRALIQFSASEAFMAKLERVRALAWHRLPANTSLEQVFELALDVLIEKEDPRVRQERREEKRRLVQTPETTPVCHDERPPARTGQRTRHIPAPVRDRVFVRDKERCTYTSSNGRRCASTRALQVDHITPLARGGASTSDNLRLLCAYHNRLEAERLMGFKGGRDGPPPR